MRLLLSSAVLGSGCYGRYDYRPGSPELLVEWVRAHLAAHPEDPQSIGSRIGYRLTAEYVQAVCDRAGIAYRPELSRGSAALSVGDEALVVRPRYREEPEPLDRRRRQPVEDADWEIAYLTRVSDE